MARTTCKAFFIMYEHDLFTDVVFLNFPAKGRKRVEGCYLIGDIYIGASRNIRQRILQHIRLSLSKKHRNKKLQGYIFSSIFLDKLTVTFLSSNVMDEQRLTDTYNLIPSPRAKFYHQMYQSKA